MSLSQETTLEQWAPVLATGLGSSCRGRLQYKGSTRFPLQSWHCCSFLITKWIYLLQREKASYRLFSQLSICLPVLGPIFPQAPAEFLSQCVSFQMDMVSCSSPQGITQSRESSYGGKYIFWESFCHFFYLPIVINWMTCSFLSSKVYNFDFWAAQTCERKWCNTDLVPVSFGFQRNVVSWVIWESRVHH